MSTKAKLARLQKTLNTRLNSQEYQRKPYTPYGIAREYFEDKTSEEKLISGGAGTGKSLAALQDVINELETYAGARALIVRKTRASMSETILVTLENHVLGLDHPSVAGGAQRTHRHSYTLPNGSMIVLAGLDNPIKIMSSEFDIAYIPEAIELYSRDWELVTTRLRNGVTPVQRLLADTNPSHENHWLLKRCKAGSCKIYYAQHTDNPIFYNQETMELTDSGRSYLSKLNRLSPLEKQGLLHGKWTTASGVVYESFNQNIHVIDREKLPRLVKHYRAIDFGYRNPFVCLWIGEDFDGNLYVYRELYETGLTVEDAAKVINHYSVYENNGKKYHQRYEATICDHDPQGTAVLEKYLHGNVKTVLAYKSVLIGIEEVQKRLRVKDNGEPSLYLVRDSLIKCDETLAAAGKPTCLRDEFDVYAWHKEASGKQVKENPNPENDHALDSLRYCIAYTAKLGIEKKKRKSRVNNIQTVILPKGSTVRKI